MSKVAEADGRGLVQEGEDRKVIQDAPIDGVIFPCDHFVVFACCWRFRLLLQPCWMFFALIRHF